MNENNPLESERIATILSEAKESIGDSGRSLMWLNQPNRALGGETPLQACATEAGAQRVLRVLGRIEYGGIS